MSSDEQLLEGVRLMKERTEARKQVALLSQRIKDTGRELSQVAKFLSLDKPGQIEEEAHAFSLSLSILRELKIKNSLVTLTNDVEEHQAKARRIKEITDSLIRAGIES